MPAESTQVKNRLVPFVPKVPEGQRHIAETGLPSSGNFQLNLGAEQETVTGGNNGYQSDITYNQSSALVTINAGRCPMNLRPVVDEVTISVNGGTAWAGGQGLYLSDTSGGAPFAFWPTTALGALSKIALPQSEQHVPLLLTASSYNSGTGVITLPASSLINASLAGYPFYVVGGTGAGQVAGIISANTATTITPVTAPNSLYGGATPLDSTSVIAVPYYISTSSGSATTIAASNGAFTSSALIGYWVYIVGGTGAGQFRQITANTSTTLTVATWTTNPDTTSVFIVTTNPGLQGSLDLCTRQWPFGTINTGLQFQLQGTFSAGSPIRARTRSYWAN
jgi:hypothetical protein